MSEAIEKWKRSGFERVYTFQEVDHLPSLLLLRIDTTFKVANLTDEEQSYFTKIEFEKHEAVKQIWHRISLNGMMTPPLHESTKPLVASGTRRDVVEARTDDVKVPAGDTALIESRWASLVEATGSDLMSFGKPITGVSVRFVAPNWIGYLAEFAQPPSETQDGFFSWDYTFIEWQHINVRWWVK